MIKRYLMNVSSWKIKKLFLIIFILLLFFRNEFSIAQDLPEDFSYKLAVIHVKAADPENALLNPSAKPNQSIVTEFHWIMETLKNRCLNPETAIADTLIETWQRAKNIGYTGSLLQISRELSVDARNYKRSSDEKVNFRMTSAHWLSQLQARMKTTGFRKGNEDK